MAAALEFTKVQNPRDLIPVLKLRHPHSCFMLNQVQKHEGFNFVFYTVGQEIGENTWIVSDNIRNDYGSHVSISAPSSIVNGKNEIPKEISDLFSAGQPVLNWDGDLVFVGLEKAVSKMIYDISVNFYGNITEVHPCNLYYMEILDALKLEIMSPPHPVEVRKLNPDQGDENFIVSGWRYARPGSEIDVRNSIRVNASGGVFIDGKCISGVNIPGYGLLSALYTNKDQRNKGYGKLTMRFAFKECAKENCTPCLTVEVRNKRSISFHESLQMKLVSVVDWMDVKKLDVD